MVFHADSVTVEADLSRRVSAARHNLSDGPQPAGKVTVESNSRKCFSDLQ